MVLSILGFAAFLVAADAAPAPPQGDGGMGLVTLMPLFACMAIAYYFFILLPMKKDQKTRQDMLSNVKKNDRVITTSGIYGVVTNVQKEQNEITVRVDETTNSKLRLTLNSIARVLGNESPDGSDPLASKQ